MMFEHSLAKKFSYDLLVNTKFSFLEKKDINWVEIEGERNSTKISLNDYWNVPVIQDISVRCLKTKDNVINKTKKINVFVFYLTLETGF